MGVYDDEDVAARDAREEEEEEEIGQVRRRRRRRRDRGNDAARDIRDDEGCEREGIERARAGCDARRCRGGRVALVATRDARCRRREGGKISNGA